MKYIQVKWRGGITFVPSQAETGSDSELNLYEQIIKELWEKTNKNSDVEEIDLKREFIVCSAIWYKDGIHVQQPNNIIRGVVVSGLRHNNCIYTASMMNKGELKFVKKEQGFLTNTHRFVSREEALSIAIKAKQVIEGRNCMRGKLDSSDLY